MSDVKIRALERTAAESGSNEDEGRLRRERCRVGQHCGCHDPLKDCSVRLNRMTEVHTGGAGYTVTTLQFQIVGDREAVDAAVRKVMVLMPEGNRVSSETLIVDDVNQA